MEGLSPSIRDRCLWDLLQDLFPGRHGSSNHWPEWAGCSLQFCTWLCIWAVGRGEDSFAFAPGWGISNSYPESPPTLHSGSEGEPCTCSGKACWNAPTKLCRRVLLEALGACPKNKHTWNSDDLAPGPLARLGGLFVRCTLAASVRCGEPGALPCSATKDGDGDPKKFLLWPPAQEDRTCHTYGRSTMWCDKLIHTSTLEIWTAILTCGSLVLWGDAKNGLSVCCGVGWEKTSPPNDDMACVTPNSPWSSTCSITHIISENKSKHVRGTMVQRYHQHFPIKYLPMWLKLCNMYWRQSSLPP